MITASLAAIYSGIRIKKKTLLVNLLNINLALNVRWVHFFGSPKIQRKNSCQRGAATMIDAEMRQIVWSILVCS